MMNKRNLFFALTLAAGTLIGCNSGTPTETKPTEGGTKPAETSSSSRPAPIASGNKADGSTIKIGIVASLNGELKPWGDDSLGGAKLAVDEANKAGGINGKNIELLVEDSASKPEQGKTGTDRLIGKGVLGVLGEVASGITAQMADSAFAAGVPVVAIGATKTTLTDKGSNIFRVCYTDDFQGPVMARFAFEELRLRNIAILTDQKQPYSTGLSDSFRKKYIELGGKIIDEQFYNSGDQQFTAQLTNIKGKNPDGLFLSGYFTEVGRIARTVKEVGMNVKLLGGDGWDSLDLLSGGGEGIIGGYFCNHYNDRESRPEVKSFLDKWKAANGGKLPGTTMGALGYDAAALMIDALKRSKEMNSVSLIDALANTENFPGVSGAITLKGQNGNPPKRALVVEVTAKGQEFRKAYDFFK